MLELVLNKQKNFFLIVLHILLGIAGAKNKWIIGIFYVIIFLILALDVVQKRDKNSRAGFYALYLMGFEIIYRISGVTLAYEMGKYMCILMLILGTVVSTKKNNSSIYYFALFLLLPSILITDGPNASRIRKSIMFNISGPLSLVFSGLYFYKRRISVNAIFTGVRVAFLPAFSILLILSLKSSIGDMEFQSIQSNSDAAGGFGANQVSSALGWFIFLGLLVVLNKQTVTGIKKLDLPVIGFLLLRALLTFSRGGVLAAVLAIMASTGYLILRNPSFRRQIQKAMGYIVLGLFLIFGVLIYANSITNNYLLYRYQGKSTKEVTRGIETPGKDILTGRTALLEADIEAFKENPLFGVGYGGSLRYHMRYGQALTAHTEFTRLLAENGIFGLLYMLVFFLIIPLGFFINVKNTRNIMFFIGFILISFFTMFHGAMRLSMAGVLYGAAFMILLTPKPKRKLKYEYTVHRK